MGAYDVRSDYLIAFALLLWGLLPLSIPIVLFHVQKRFAAWGWLLMVLVFGYFVLITVARSESSTAAFDFLWAPLWSLVLVGPVGALVGSVLERKFG